MQSLESTEKVLNSLIDRAVQARSRRVVSIANIEECVRRVASLRNRRTPHIVWARNPDEAFTMVEQRFHSIPTRLEANAKRCSGSFWNAEIGHRAYRDPSRKGADVLLVKTLDVASKVCTSDLEDKLFAQADARFHERLYGSCITSRQLLDALARERTLSFFRSKLSSEASRSIFRLGLTLENRFKLASTVSQLAIATFEAWESGLWSTWKLQDDLVCLTISIA